MGQCGEQKTTLQKPMTGPGQTAQLVRVLSGYAEVAGSILRKGTCKNQPRIASVSGITNLSVSLSLHPSLKSTYKH